MAATARWLGMLYITMFTYRLLVETIYMYIGMHIAQYIRNNYRLSFQAIREVSAPEPTEI